MLTEKTPVNRENFVGCSFVSVRQQTPPTPTPLPLTHDSRKTAASATAEGAATRSLRNFASYFASVLICTQCEGTTEHFSQGDKNPENPRLTTISMGVGGVAGVICGCIRQMVTRDGRWHTMRCRLKLLPKAKQFSAQFISGN